MKGGPTHGVPLEFQGENLLLLKCRGNIGIPLQMKQGNGPSSREEEWKTRLFLSCCETQYFSHVGTGISGTFQSCIKGVNTLSRFQKKRGISLETLLWKRATFRVEGRISCFFLSCGRKLGFLSSCDGTSGTHSCCLREVGSLLELRGARWDSS